MTRSPNRIHRSALKEPMKVVPGRSVRQVEGNLMKTARDAPYDPTSLFRSLRPITPLDRERAELRGMGVREFLEWRDALRDDYRMRFIWPRFTLLMGLVPLRSWMVPEADVTTPHAWNRVHGDQGHVVQ